MYRAFKIAAVGLLIAVPLLIWLRKARNPVRVESQELPTTPALLAAPGRVEGRGQTISLGAGIDGIVKEVLVTEGQKVSQGTLLAVIDCKDISAEIDLAKAQAETARQARNLLLRGHREEEREAADRETDAAKAVLLQVREHLKRIGALYQKDEVSRDEFERNERDLEVAQANYEKAVDEQNLANAGPLPEEISRANAQVAAAERTVNVATDKLDKCNVRAPIAGTVLKVMTKVGESYSTLLPRPLLTLADDSVRRVRAEVDERDIGKIKLGQEAIITADAFPGRTFEGQVVQISRAMEPISVLTEDPAQKTDHDVLDVIIELKRSQNDLPLGLQVTAQVTSAGTQLAESSNDAPATPPHMPVADPPKQSPLAPPAALTKPKELVLQVGAMTHRENADALAAMLRRKSFPAFVLERDQFYRVDVGPYPDFAHARIAKNELKGGGFGTAIERQLPGSTR